MFKVDLVLNNLQWFICYKTQSTWPYWRIITAMWPTGKMITPLCPLPSQESSPQSDLPEESFNLIWPTRRIIPNLNPLNNHLRNLIKLKKHHPCLNQLKNWHPHITSLKNHHPIQTLLKTYHSNLTPHLKIITLSQSLSNSLFGALLVT